MGNLSLSQVVASQNSKETTINDADAQLESALTAKASIDLTAFVSGTVLSIAQYLRAVRIDFTGALAADIEVDLLAVSKLTIFSNSTTGGHKVTLKITGSAGDTLVLAPSSLSLAYADGTNVDSVSSGGGGGASVSITASEAIAANDFVNLWNNAGTMNVRKATAADPTKYAHGFAPFAIGLGASGTVDIGGMNSLTVGATPYPQAYLDDVTPGSWRSTPPATVGHIVQPLGPAIPGNGIAFTPQPFVQV
jgi:hypothetical protein